MGVYPNGGVGGYAERAMLPAYFGAASETIPATIYLGLGSAAVVDVANAGASVTYTATTLSDASAPFQYGGVVLNLIGAWVQSGASTGVVLSNTTTTLTLASSWTTGTPSAAAQYDVSLFNEPNGNAYTRLALTNNGTNFAILNTPSLLLSGSQVGVATQVSFPVASGGGWGAIAWAFLADVSTVGQGRVLAAQPFAIPLSVVGGQSVTIPVNGFTMALA